MRFYLTETGKRKAMVEGFLPAVQLRVENFFKTLLDEGIEHGERGALTGASGIVKSKASPILGFLYLVSIKQYRKLTKKLESEEPRKEISNLFGKLIDFYASEPDQLHADYLTQKESVFFIGNLPLDVSQQMKEAINMDLFRNYFELLRGLSKLAFVQLWKEIWKHFQDSEFREGKKGFEDKIKYYYNPKRKIIESVA